MSTVLKEIECTFNDRPLISVSADICERALTSNHLLYSKCLSQTPVNNNDKDIVKDLNKNQKHIQNFKNGWKREYLAELRSMLS